MRCYHSKQAEAILGIKRGKLRRWANHLKFPEEHQEVLNPFKDPRYPLDPGRYAYPEEWLMAVAELTNGATNFEGQDPAGWWTPEGRMEDAEPESDGV